MKTRLRDTTRKIISSLEKKSGYPVQVIEDPDLSTIAEMRIARGDMPAHILKIKSLTPHLTIQLASNVLWFCAYLNARQRIAS